MLEFADRDIKTVIITVLHMFKMLCRDMENIKKKMHQTKIPEMTIIMSDEKYTRWD